MPTGTETAVPAVPSATASPAVNASDDLSEFEEILGDEVPF